MFIKGKWSRFFARFYGRANELGETLHNLKYLVHQRKNKCEKGEQKERRRKTSSDAFNSNGKTIV